MTFAEVHAELSRIASGRLCAVYLESQEFLKNGESVRVLWRIYVDGYGSTEQRGDPSLCLSDMRARIAASTLPVDLSEIG